MKRLIPAGILLAAIIIAYALSWYYVDNTCDKAITLVKECEEEYKPNGDSSIKADELKKLWDEKENALSFFVNHDKIDQVELELSSLFIYSNKDDAAKFYEHIENLKMLLHQIREDSTVSVHSIF